MYHLVPSYYPDPLVDTAPYFTTAAASFSSYYPYTSFYTHNNTYHIKTLNTYLTPLDVVAY